MKKIAVLIVAIVFVAVLTGCSGRDAQIVGDWEIVLENAERFGRYLRFEKSGAMYCTPGIGKNDTVRNIEDEFKRMADYYEISYSAKKNRVVELTITVFGEKVTVAVEYAVDGDVLIFDGKTYRRLT